MAAKVYVCSAPQALLPLQPALPDVEGRIKDVSFLQLVQLHLGITHLVFHTLQLVIQLQLLSLKFTVFLLIPVSSKVATESCRSGAETSLSPPLITI